MMKKIQEEGTEVDPTHWKNALDSAIKDAGGLEDVQAISIAGQQHGMVALDRHGEVIRPALLWNDTRSAKAVPDVPSETTTSPGCACTPRAAPALSPAPAAIGIPEEVVPPNSLGAMILGKRSSESWRSARRKMSSR